MPDIKPPFVVFSYRGEPVWVNALLVTRVTTAADDGESYIHFQGGDSVAVAFSLTATVDALRNAALAYKAV